MAEELSVDCVLKFLDLHGGKVKNSILVPHFKKFFSKPETRDSNRQKFKEIVNSVATVVTENGDKYILLKKKFRQSVSSTDNESPQPPKTPTPEPTSEPTSEPISAEIEDQNVTKDDQNMIKDDLPTIHLNNIKKESVEDADVAKEESSESSNQLSDFNKTEEAAKNESKVQRRSKKDLTSSPNLNERHSALIGRIRSSVASGGQTNELRARNRPISVYQGNLPGSFEKVRQNFVNKPKNLDDSTTSLNSQASLSSKEVDPDEDYGRTSPALFLNPHEKQWSLSCCRSDLVGLRKLLDQDETLVNKKDFVMGYTALHWAAKKGDSDMTRLLIDLNVNLNPKSNGGYTPLHMAAMSGHEEVVTLLLKSGADPNIRDFSGRFPIHYLKCITPPLLSKSRPNCSSAPKWCFHAFSGTPHTRARSDKLLLKLGEQTRAFSTNQRHAMSFAFPYGSAGRRRPSPDVTSRARLGSFAEPSTPHVDVGVKSPAGGSKVSRSESKLFSFMRRNSYRGAKSKSLHSDVTGKPKSIHSDVTGKPKSIHSDVTAKSKSVHSDVTGKPKSIHSDVTGKRLQQAEEIAKETPPPPPSAAVIRATPASRFMWKPTTKP